MSSFTQQLEKMKTHPGFIAALDQSGGSTPKALTSYGIKEGAWSNEEEMFAIVHQMRTRIITSPSFTGERILGAILFENTMDRAVKGQTRFGTVPPDELVDGMTVGFLRTGRCQRVENCVLRLLQVGQPKYCFGLTAFR